MSAKASAQEDTSPQIVCNSPDDVRCVSVLSGYQLLVEFMDGTSGIVDMKSLIFSAKAGVFKALADQQLFSKVWVKYGTIAWPGEIDLSPSEMYSAIKKQGIWKPS